MSRWLQQELDSLEEFTKKKGKSTPIAMIGIGIVFLLCMVAAIIYGQNNPDYEAGGICAFLGGMGVFLILMALLTLSKSKKNVGLPKLEKQLAELLTTPELVEEFDNEMLNAPLHRMSGEPGISFTEHYLVDVFGNLGVKTYSFTRLEKIAMTKVSAMRDPSSIGRLSKIYDVDLCDANGKKLTGVTIHKRANMEEFDDALMRYCPGIQLASH